MVPRRNEQRLGSPEAATSSCARPLGLAGAADRGGDRCGPRDGSAAICWPPGSRCAVAGGQANRAAKPAISVEVSTDSSLAKPAISARRCPPTRRARAPGACAERERLRAVSRADCRGAGAWAQRRRDLARPGRRPRLLRAVRECPPLRRDTARHARRPRRASSSRPRPAKKARSTTARRPDGPRPRARASTGARGSSS